MAEGQHDQQHQTPPTRPQALLPTFLPGHNNNGNTNNNSNKGPAPPGPVRPAVSATACPDDDSHLTTQNLDRATIYVPSPVNRNAKHKKRKKGGLHSLFGNNKEDSDHVNSRGHSNPYKTAPRPGITSNVSISGPMSMHPPTCWEHVLDIKKMGKTIKDTAVSSQVKEESGEQVYVFWAKAKKMYDMLSKANLIVPLGFIHADCRDDPPAIYCWIPKSQTIKVQIPDLEGHVIKVLYQMETVEEFIKVVISKFQKLKDTPPSDWILKISGLSEYLCNPNALLCAYVPVQNAIKRKLEVVLELIQKSNEGVKDALPVLENHLSLLASNNPLFIPLCSDSMQLSLPTVKLHMCPHYELSRPLVIHVEGISNLKPDSVLEYFEEPESSYSSHSSPSISSPARTVHTAPASSRVSGQFAPVSPTLPSTPPPAGFVSTGELRRTLEVPTTPAKTRMTASLPVAIRSLSPPPPELPPSGHGAGETGGGNISPRPLLAPQRQRDVDEEDEDQEEDKRQRRHQDRRRSRDPNNSQENEGRRLLQQTQPNLNSFHDQYALYGIVFWVDVYIFVGDQEIDYFSTKESRNLHWKDGTISLIWIPNLPFETRLQFVLRGKQLKGKPVALGETSLQLFDFSGKLRCGSHDLMLRETKGKDPSTEAVPLEPGEESKVGVASPSPRLGAISNSHRPSAATKMIPSAAHKASPPHLVIRFEEFNHPVIYKERSTTDSKRRKMDEEEELRLETLCLSDIMEELSEEDKAFLWQHRMSVMFNYPNALEKVLSGVNWKVLVSVETVHTMLERWPKLPPVHALKLLDYKQHDSKVRDFAVKCLISLNDYELIRYMLLLVEMLRFEPYHDSSLARFLLERALRSRSLVGNYLFWALKSQGKDPARAIRYNLLLDVYLTLSGDHRIHLVNTYSVIKSFTEISKLIQEEKSDDVRKEILTSSLTGMTIPPEFILPVRPSMKVERLVVEKCKFMDSFTVPLWLVFENSENYRCSIIFKSGDDLRQDELTITLLREMDNNWKQEGIDCHMLLYSVLSTGKNQGIIEVVPNSRTNAYIQKKHAGVVGALSNQPIKQWLQKECSKDLEFREAVFKFTQSCAAYCAASYVLGLGDRHNDNIMVADTGQIFHIDFAHFLGNTMKFAGYNRETAPFVMTSEYLEVIGGEDSENYVAFLKLAIFCYQMLRMNRNMIIILFSLMVRANIPELSSLQDIMYVHKALCTHLDDEEANKHFLHLIHASIKSKGTRINFLIHNIVHPD